MNISNYFIKRPIGITLIVLSICAIGLSAYFKLSVSDIPTVDYPVVTVAAFYPGANPQTMADAIATPLEQQLIRVQGLKNIISVSTDSFTRIILTFDLGYELNTVIPDIQNAISYAQGYMPKLPDSPSFTKTNPSEKPIMFLIADSETIPHDELFQLSDKKISQPISMTEGISSVTIWSVSSAIRIYLDPHKMAQYDITLSDVSYALSSSSSLSSGGYLSDKYRTFSILPDGQLMTPEGYNNLILKYQKNEPIRISDIGLASYTPQQINYMLQYSDNTHHKSITNPVMLSISRKDGSNTVNLIDGVKKMIEKIKPELPRSFNLSIAYDRSLAIIGSIYEMKVTLAFVILLVIVVIYFSIGKITATFIPVVIIPVSLLGTFAVMYIANYSVDNLSLLALTLAIGFIVDDSIVVLENTSRHIENGLLPDKASQRSSLEITPSIISMTTALIIVFIPILFMEGAIGEIFREFAVVAIVMIIISGTLSLTLTPMMCANILVTNENSKKSRLQKWVSILLKRVIKKYAYCLKIFLKRPSYSIILWLICIGCSFLFYFMVPKNFLPNGDSGTIFGSIQLPIGLSSERAQKFQDAVDDILKKDKNIAKFFTITGMYSGADQSTGLMTIMLKDREERQSMDQVLSELRNKFANMPFNLGAVYLNSVPVLDINAGGETTANGAQYSYLITGLDRDKVFKYGQIFEAELRENADFKDVQSDIKLNLPQLNIKINRDKASSLGISVTDIENSLLSAYSQGRVAQYIENSSFYDVIVELADKYSSTPQDLSALYLKSSVSGNMVPLSAIVEIIKGAGPQSVTHYQQMSAATISFNLANGVPLGTAVEELESAAQKILPDGVTGELQGDAKQFVSSMRNLSLLIVLAVFLMFIVLGLLYESYVYPIAVLTTIPIAVTGAIGSLLLFDSELSLFAYVGLFLLLGIIVKNGIMMIDLALQKIRVEKKTAFDAIYGACLIRFRPILMTGLTSIFAGIPLAVGLGIDTSLRRPLGLVIIGGLIVAQILTLFVTPGIFLYAHKIQINILNKYRLTKSSRS
ncbi:MAG: efflux RND transporter permease subunit [Lentisphaerota bacterium]